MGSADSTPDRTLVKQLAMRRTLFVFPRDLLPAAWGSAGARVAPTLATAWLDGVRVGSVYSSPAMKQATRSWPVPKPQT